MAPRDALTTHPVVHRVMAKLQVAPGLIGIHGTLYDARDFDHPGGALWLHAVAGSDATELFEMSHLNIARARRALNALPKRGTYERTLQRDYTLYARLRAVAVAHLATAPSCGTGKGGVAAWAGACVASHVLLLSMPALTIWWCAWCVVVAMCNAVLGGYGHDALHRLHPQTLFLDWNGLSTYEWLLEHVVSHHPHVNTEHDHDAKSMEPFVVWHESQWRNAVAYPIFAIGELVVAAHGYVGHRCRWRAPAHAPAWLRMAPWLFVGRACLHLGCQGMRDGALTLVCTLLIASAYFSYLAHLSHAPGGNTSHTCVVRHQLAHTGDIATAWPQLAMFLDRQTMHHLFPTIPHAKLTTALRDALAATHESAAFQQRSDLPRLLHKRLVCTKKADE